MTDERRYDDEVREIFGLAADAAALVEQRGGGVRGRRFPGP